jgi:DNA-directed RNA polymerase specialized sigma24 family protein
VRTSRPPTFDLGRAEQLVLAVIRGDRAAFSALIALIWPDLSRSVAGSRRLAAGGVADDGAHDVGLRIIEKLERDDFRALRLYGDWRQRHPDKTLLDWLRIVAANVTRDYLREIRGHGKADDLPSPNRLLNALSGVISAADLGTRPPMTAAQTARQLLAFARTRLPRAQFSALEQWLKGSSFEEIAEGTGLRDAGEARRSVRAAIAVMRREFSAGETD